MEPARLVLLIGALLLGACVGSFVNVLIFRLPREKSVVSPGSHCFCCGTALTPRDLVPVFSFLFAGRRCRYCGVVLSGQYAIVEALCALLYAALFWRWGPSITTVAWFIAAAAMVAAVGTDLHFKIIPNALNQTILLAGIGGALLSQWFPPPVELPYTLLGPTGAVSPVLSVVGALVGWLTFETIVRLGRWWFGQEAMGGGDVLLAAGVGALLGPGRLFFGFFMVSILAGAIVGGALLLLGRKGRREPIPFGPYLVCGALCLMLFPQIGSWIAGFYGFN